MNQLILKAEIPVRNTGKLLTKKNYFDNEDINVVF
jgi:hypothetical protein